MSKVIVPLASKRENSVMKAQEQQILTSINKQFELEGDEEGDLMLKRLNDLQYQVQLDLKQLVEIQPMERVISQEDQAAIENLDGVIARLKDTLRSKQECFQIARAELNTRRAQLESQVKKEIQLIIAETAERSAKLVELPISDQQCYDPQGEESLLSDQLELIYSQCCQTVVESDMRQEEERNQLMKLVKLRRGQNLEMANRLEYMIKCERFYNE